MPALLLTDTGKAMFTRAILWFDFAVWCDLGLKCVCFDCPQNVTQILFCNLLCVSGNNLNQFWILTPMKHSLTKL
jgi:hypothetical protein